jgi:oligosaccharide reducing-end xylanase
MNRILSNLLKGLTFYTIKGTIVITLLAVSYVVECFAQPGPQSSSKLKSNDGNGAYKTGNYRNLFLENGHSETEITAKVNHAFQTFFYGDTSQKIYFDAGKNENGALAYLKDVLHNDVRSEGISYGMMICVQMNKKAEFDALWNWAMTYMYNTSPDNPSEGYFAWSVKDNGIPLDDSAAPDGEEFFVMSLYFASGRWGDGQGIYNYKAWADKIITTIRHRQQKTGQTKLGQRTIGSMVNEEAKMIRFVPTVGMDFTDPSYHLPAFYELWARWAPESEREFWAAAADTSRNFFQKTTHPLTGLAPDYANYDGTPHKIFWNPNAHHFAFDSWRTAINYSVDWAWWKKDPREQELSNRIQSFFASKGMKTYGVRYTLDGNVLEDRQGTGLISANAVVSLAANHAIAKDFVEAFWNEPLPLAFTERYYSGTLYLMNILHCSGNYRIWEPKI